MSKGYNATQVIVGIYTYIVEGKLIHTYKQYDLS